METNNPEKSVDILLAYSEQKTPDVLSSFILKNSEAFYRGATLSNIASNSSSNFFSQQEIETACFFDESGDDCPNLSKKHAVSLIVVDVEVTYTQFLIGFYFVHIDTYIPMYFFSGMPEQDFQILFTQLSIFFEKMKKSTFFTPEIMYESDSFNNLFQKQNVFGTKNKNAMFVQPMLLTFNGYYFDVPLITLFLNGTSSFFSSSFLSVSTNRLRDELELFSKQKKTIEEQQTKKIETISVYTKSVIEENKRLEIFNFSKKTSEQEIFHLDLYRCLNDENKATSLELLKNDLYVASSLKNIEIEKPQEFLKKFEDKQAIVPVESLKDWKNYNRNDCFYTACAFLKKPMFRDSFVSRFLLYKLMPLDTITFASSLNFRKGRLVISYLKQKGVDISSVAKKDTISLKDLTILYPYPKALPVYETFFNGVDFISAPSEETAYAYKNQTLQFSKGGLHSKFEEPFLYFETSDDSIILDLDVAGYYVELLKQICSKMNFMQLSNEIESLNQKSLELKKAGKTNLRKPIKIILLSVTGNLNAVTNQEVYAPNLYFSITANGQLMITELLLEIQQIVDKLIFVNTDGFCIQIQRSKQRELEKIVHNFEQKYHVVLETNQVTRGIVKDVNNYIFLQEDNSIKSKGSGKDEFGFVDDFFKYVLENNLFQLLQRDHLQIIHKFFEHHFCPQNLPKYFVTKSRKSDRKTFYFCKQPISWNGLLVGGTNHFAGFPISYFSFQECENSGFDFVCTIFNQLDKIQYIKYLEKNVLYKRKFIEKERLQDITKTEFDAIFGPSVFYESGIIHNAIRFAKTTNICFIPKNVNKKSFKGFKNPTQNSEKTAEAFLQKSFQTNFKYWIEAKGISVINHLSFPFVVFDFDNKKFVFQKKAFPFLKKLAMLQKHKQCVILGSPVFNGMYTFKIIVHVQNFDSFFDLQQEINESEFCSFVKIEEQATILGAHMFTTSLKPTITTQNVIVLKKTNLEQFFETYDDPAYCEKLHVNYLHTIFWNSLFVQDHIEVANWLATKSKRPFAKIVDPDEIESKTFISMLSDRFLFQKITKQSKKNMEAIKFLENKNQTNPIETTDEKKEQIPTKFEEPQLQPQKKTKPRPGPRPRKKTGVVPTLWLKQTPIEIPETTQKNTNSDVFIDSSFLKTYGVYFEKKEPDVTQDQAEIEVVEFLKTLSSLSETEKKKRFIDFHKENGQLLKQTNKKQLNQPIENPQTFFEKSNKLTFLETANVIIKTLNKQHGFSFSGEGVFLKEETNTILFRSNCIFKKDTDNRVMNLFLNERHCTIYCFHESCRNENKYAPFEMDIRSKLLESFLEIKPLVQKETDQRFKNLEDLFDQILNKKV